MDVWVRSQVEGQPVQMPWSRIMLCMLEEQQGERGWREMHWGRTGRVGPQDAPCLGLL